MPEGWSQPSPEAAHSTSRKEEPDRVPRFQPPPQTLPTAFDLQPVALAELQLSPVDPDSER